LGSKFTGERGVNQDLSNINKVRIEEADLEKMTFTLSLAEDLDCSGLPTSDETICTYDEGFLSGLLSEYTGKNFSAKEVDCWCSGDRACRFEAKAVA
jgi:predicted hydrocarbon binding protein